MALFTISIFDTAHSAALEQAIQQRYPQDHYKLSNLQWIVFDRQILTRDLAENMGIRSGTFGIGLVLKFDTYSGRYNSSLWEWLRTKLDSNSLWKL